MNSAESHSLRVLQIVLSLGAGGTERLVIEIVRRLRADMPMTVCCLDQEGVWGAALKGEGLDVVALERGPGFQPSLGLRIAAIVRRHHIDVIHCHHYSPFVYACVARMFHPSVRIVFTEHGRLSDAPPSPKRRIANALLSHVPHEVFTVSADLKQHIVAEGFPERSVGVLYNGIDVGPLPGPDARSRMRASLGLDPGTFVVATVARLDPVKDLAVLINASVELNRTRRATLLVVGDGDERAALEGAARALNAGDAVRFLGHRDDARAVLAGCDAYANSSISEGISLTILEAMAAGLPVVATRVGGTPEIIDESCGRLVPARDAAAMSAVLATLADDRGLGRTLGCAGRQRVEIRFTLDWMVREYRDAYVRAAAA